MARSSVLGRLFMASAVLLQPVVAQAQETTINGTITELSRLDMRVQRRCRLGSRVSLDGMLEVFNIFNRAN